MPRMHVLYASTRYQQAETLLSLPWLSDTITHPAPTKEIVDNIIRRQPVSCTSLLDDQAQPTEQSELAASPGIDHVH